MKPHTSNEEKLLGFFGKITTVADDNKSWNENTNIYTAKDENIELIFAIEPQNEFIAIIMKIGSKKLYEYAGEGFRLIEVYNYESIPTLKVSVNHNSRIHIQISPQITVFESVDNAKSNK